MSGQAWRKAADGEVRKRSGIEIVSAAGRLAQSRAAAAGLRSVELRVFGAVVSLTVMWTKLVDEVYIVQVAELAGIGGSEKNMRREAGRALGRLAELGIITYAPAAGRGQRSRIGLPSLVVQKGGSEHNLSNDKGGVDDPPFTPKGCADSPRKVVRFDPERVGNGVPPTEKIPSQDPRIPEPERAVKADELLLDFRAGIEDNTQGHGQDLGTELLEAVARAAPASARHELLDDPDQAPGRATLRRRLVALADLVGFDAAVVVVAGEWPTAVVSPMAHANARARARLEGHPVAAPSQGPIVAAPTPVIAPEDSSVPDRSPLVGLAEARRVLTRGGIHG